MKKLVAFCLFLYCSQARTQNVDQFVDYINSFIDNSTSYVRPTDNSVYLEGNPEKMKGCKDAGKYDFIIVGAGSAGTVIARRLSENKTSTVLVIEAGGNETEFSDIPGYFQYLLASNFNWGYKSVPQKNSLHGFVNSTEFVPRGRVLGGSSVLNAMMYVRGNAIDYDRWEAQGNPGWAYKDVLPYFKKSEHANLTIIDPAYHGLTGPLSVEQINVLSPITQAFIDANKELGRVVLDYNGKSQNGFSILQVNEKNGRRDSGNKAFLKPVRDRKNLKVLTHALVTEIILHKCTAKGIKYLQGGKYYCAYANKEIILSAGTINSPQLLMLAGIGPADHLKEHGIKVVQNLTGVGENMWDHLTLNQFPFTTNYTEASYTQKQQVQMYLNGRGPLTCADNIQDIGFVHLLNNDTSPDVEHILVTATTPNYTNIYYQHLFNIGQEMYDALIKPLIGVTTWKSYALLLHPKSRGTVKLKSKNPLDFPLIDPNYFSDPNQIDLKTCIAAIRDMIRISNTKTMQKYASKFYPTQLGKCKQYKIGTDEYFGCLVQYLANTIHHWSGTCKMGPKKDKMSVVDNKLRVHGVNKLRVADCSVIPVTIAGHTNAVAYMIGEKAADIIKKDHKL